MSTIRKKGLAYLEKYLGHRPSERVAVSKFYEPDESWTQRPTWWFDLPIEKIEERMDEDYYLVCEHKDVQFVILKVPNIFFLNNIEDFETRNDNKIRLHLAAYKDNWLVDERGKGGVDFSQFQINL